MDTIITLIETATNLIVGMLSLLIALSLGIITIIIQRRQSKMQRYQYRLDMYNRRFDYYKRLKDSFPFSVSETGLENILFMYDDKYFNTDDYQKYLIFYSDAKMEFKFVFGIEIYSLLEEFNGLMYKWQNSGDRKEKRDIAKIMGSIYFDKLNPSMERLLMLKVL